MTRHEPHRRDPRGTRSSGTLESGTAGGRRMSSGHGEFRDYDEDYDDIGREPGYYEAAPESRLERGRRLGRRDRRGMNRLSEFDENYGTDERYAGAGGYGFEDDDFERNFDRNFGRGSRHDSERGYGQRPDYGQRLGRSEQDRYGAGGGRRWDLGYGETDSNDEWDYGSDERRSRGRRGR